MEKKSRNIPEAKPEFTERMKNLLGKDYAEYLEILKEQPVRSIRCNELKISPKDLKSRLEQKRWKIKQPWKENPEVMIVEGKYEEGNKVNEEHSYNLTETKSKVSNLKNLIELDPGELGRALEHLLGYYYIQELASMLPIIALSPKQNELVLDLCSSPGSKTTQVASKMQNTGTIIANEVSLGRIKILAANLERCGVTNTIVTKKEGASLCNKFKKMDIQFDKILVDAPCSGEGTLRSTHKTYAMWNIKTVKALPRIQTNLFESALEILKPNGTLIYSTCTHSPEENEGVLDYILKKYKGKIKVEKIQLPIKPRPGITAWQNKEYQEEVKLSCRVYPQDNNTEGFFLVKIRRIK